MRVRTSSVEMYPGTEFVVWFPDATSVPRGQFMNELWVRTNDRNFQ